MFAIRPTLLYGTKCLPVKKVFEQRMKVTEMHMLSWMCGNTMTDRIRNQEFREKLGVAPLCAKMRENKLRWFGHVQRKTHDACIRVKGKRIRERPWRT